MEYRATTDNNNNNNNNKIQVSRDWNINEGKKTPPPPIYIMLFHDSFLDKMEMAIVQA